MNPFIIPGLKKINIDPQLNSNYQFENFIEGDCNRLARSAGYAVAQKPAGTAFNPLVIWGGVGLGKTHLAQAIGSEIKGFFASSLSAAPCDTTQYIQLFLFEKAVINISLSFFVNPLSFLSSALL